MANSLDFMFSTFIFLIVFMYLILLYSNYVDKYNIEEVKRALESEALSASEILVKTQGVPYNWEKNTSQIYSIGLANSENVLDGDKVSFISSLNYDLLKNYTGFSRDYYLRLKTISGTTVFEKGNSTGELSVSIIRTVIYNNSIARLTVRLYG
ncbi:MAG: hypothetical protein ABII22_00830 [Candidatus Micrarchaeota archaeon]